MSGKLAFQVIFAKFYIANVVLNSYLRFLQLKFIIDAGTAFT